MQELKKWSDQEDKFLVYEIDPNQQYVFKSSKMRMKLARYVVLHSANCLKKEFCFFNGKHGRVNEFITLTASIHHSFLKF